jgi:hypothetical protein
MSIASYIVGINPVRVLAIYGLLNR